MRHHVDHTSGIVSAALWLPPQLAEHETMTVGLEAAA